MNKDSSKIDTQISMKNLTKNEAAILALLLVRILEDKSILHAIYDEFLSEDPEVLEPDTVVPHRSIGLPYSIKAPLMSVAIFADDELVKRYKADGLVDWDHAPSSRKPFGVKKGLGKMKMIAIGAYMAKKGFCTKEEFAERYHSFVHLSVRDFTLALAIEKEASKDEPPIFPGLSSDS